VSKAQFVLCNSQVAFCNLQLLRRQHFSTPHKKIFTHILTSTNGSLKKSTRPRQRKKSCAEFGETRWASEAHCSRRCTTVFPRRAASDAAKFFHSPDTSLAKNISSQLRSFPENEFHHATGLRCEKNRRPHSIETRPEFPMADRLLTAGLLASRTKRAARKFGMFVMLHSDVSRRREP
jgi:hypothetical protein